MTARELVPLMLVLLIGCADSEPASTRRHVATGAGLEIYDAYAPAPAAPDVGSLYFTVLNTASGPDTLVAIETSVGARATLHNMVEEGGLMRMRPTGPMPIAPHDSLRLAPGGYHVMLSDLTSQPQVGDTIQVVLTFSRAGRIGFAVPVLAYSEVVRLLGSMGSTGN